MVSHPVVPPLLPRSAAQVSLNSASYFLTYLCLVCFGAGLTAGIESEFQFPCGTGIVPRLAARGQLDPHLAVVRNSYLRSTRRECADPGFRGSSSGVLRLGFLSKLLTECWYRLGSQRLILREFRRRLALRLFYEGGGLLAIGRALGCARKSPPHEVLPPSDPQSS